MTVCALCHYEIMFWDDDVWVLTERAFASALNRDWCSATDHRPLTLSTVLYDLACVYCS